MKNQNRRKSSARIIRWVVAGMAAIVVCVADAETFDYVNTGVATGAWTVDSNWHRNNNYPGNLAGRWDVANVNSAVSGNYTVVLDQALPGNIDDLNIANTLGTATVEISVPLTIVKSTALGQNGRLVIDGVAVTGGIIGFGPDSELVLNNGGSRVLTGNGALSIGSATVGAVTALVTSASAQSTGNGILDFNNRDLRVGAHADFGLNYLCIENGVVLTNVNLQTGFLGDDNTVVVDGATVHTATAHVGNDGGAVNGGNGNLLLLDNGAIVKVGRGMTTKPRAMDNRLVIKNGSQMMGFTDNITFGRGGTNNSITVTGEGSVLDLNKRDFRFGNYDSSVLSSGASLYVGNGGVVLNAAKFQIPGEDGPAYKSRLVVDNGKIFGSGNSLFGSNGIECEFDVMGENALMTANNMNIGYCEVARNSAFVSTGNVMRVMNGATVIVTNNMSIAAVNGGIAAGALNMSGNRLEISNGGRVFVGNTINICDRGTDCLDNVLEVSTGGLLETRNITINSGSKGPVGGNFIYAQDAIMQFITHNPAINLYDGATVTLENSTLSFRNVTSGDINSVDIPILTNSANIAKIAFIGDTALRLSASMNRANTVQSYTFDKGLGAAHFYRLDLVDGITHYRSLNGAGQLAFGAQGEMFCSNTTATVALATTVDGSLTVLDSTVTFERNLVVNGDLFIDTDAVAAGGNIITVEGDLTLGPNSRIFIKGKSQEPVTIVYNGVRSGKFAEKVCADENYAIMYGTGDDSVITLSHAPLGTLMIVR